MTIYTLDTFTNSTEPGSVESSYLVFLTPFNGSIIEGEIIASVTNSIILSPFVNTIIPGEIISQGAQPIFDTFVNNIVSGQISASVANSMILSSFVNDIIEGEILSVNRTYNLNTYQNNILINAPIWSFDQFITLDRIINPQKQSKLVASKNVPQIVPLPPIAPVRPNVDALRQFEKKFNKKEFIFSDLALSFKAHPITGAPAVLYDEDSINQSLRMCLFTERFERPFSNILFGANIKSRLFELFSPSLARDIENHIIETVTNNEPRIQLLQVTCAERNRHSLIIVIEYKIKRTGEDKVFTYLLDRT